MQVADFSHVLRSKLTWRSLHSKNAGHRLVLVVKPFFRSLWPVGPSSDYVILREHRVVQYM